MTKDEKECVIENGQQGVSILDTDPHVLFVIENKTVRTFLNSVEVDFDKLFIDNNLRECVNDFLKNEDYFISVCTMNEKGFNFTLFQGMGNEKHH